MVEQRLPDSGADFLRWLRKPSSLVPRVILALVLLRPGAIRPPGLSTTRAWLLPLVAFVVPFAVYLLMRQAVIGETGGGTVMGPSLVKSVDASLDDVGRGIEVGFANFEMNDFFALFLELAGAVQDFKGGFGAKPRHPAGKTQFELSCGWHGGG